jgi:predicted  nucleic acid-binding Zn-ribbon protein
MLRINKVLFDLSTVYENLTQSETWKMANTLTKVKNNLEELLEDINEHQLFDKHYEEQKNAIESQLSFVNANIKTLQDALLCHQTKFIEKRTNLADLGIFCLN